MTTPKTTATDAYNQQLAAATAMLERLPAALKAHADRQAADPRNWCLAGDLEYVNAQLREALRVLEGA